MKDVDIFFNLISDLAPKGIPNATLKTWSHKGADATAKKTHESIRSFLNQLRFRSDYKPETYLQGSYRNSTNIRSDSDVDIVIEFPFQGYQLTNKKDEWIDLRNYLVKSLRNHYNQSNIEVKKKCVKLSGGNSRLPADIVIGFTQPDDPLLLSRPADGIRFYVPEEDRWVVNYPKEHYKRGAEKNSQDVTGFWFKPTVRVFKNVSARARVYAPSYFVENLIYNAPNSLFGTDYKSSFDKVLNWMLNSNFDGLISQNGQNYLFGGTPEQWNIAEAKSFARSIKRYRDNYQ